MAARAVRVEPDRRWSQSGKVEMAGAFRVSAKRAASHRLLSMQAAMRMERVVMKPDARACGSIAIAKTPLGVWRKDYVLQPVLFRSASCIRFLRIGMGTPSARSPCSMERGATQE